MHVAQAAVLLLVLTAGCAHIQPDTPLPEPPNVPRQRGTPAPAAKPSAPAPAAAPAPSAGTPTPKAAGRTAPSVAETPSVAPTLDLITLEAQLKGTKAIGIFTKLTLKNQIDDLLDQFREFYDGKANPTMKDLRRSFDLLMMKVLSLLQDEDQRLASAIVSSREAIWGLLADRRTFATFQG